MPELKYEPKLLNLDELSDFDDYFVNVPCSYALYILVLPSYDSDSPWTFSYNLYKKMQATSG